MNPRVILAAVLLATAPALPAVAADLTVSIAGVSGAGGFIHVGLYGGEDTFRKPDRAAAAQWVAAVPGQVSATFSGVAPGTYAVMAWHDENGDKELNRFLGMIPTEGYALSNDPEVSGPPPFADSAFTVAEPGVAVTMSMRY